MRKLHLLSTVAASLLLATGVAAAQGMKNEAPARAPAAQQNAPAEKIAPSMHAGERNGKAETTGQASEKMDNGNKAELKSHGKSETTGQSPKSGEPGKAQMNEQGTMKNGASRGENDVKPSESSKTGASSKSGQTTNGPNATVGQGAAGSAKLSTEQRTKITTILRKQKVQSTHLNISVHVGARVPDTVHFYPLPTEVIEIYPEWRGFDYILVGDQLIIISPRTHLIVAVLEV
jgi:hypothetical protein